MRILLIEDNPADIALVSELLQSSQVLIELSVATDGVQALNRLSAAAARDRTGLPDLIVLDLNLPGLHGHDVLTELRHDSQLAVIPVIVLTSSAVPSDVVDAYRRGANCYLTKPVGLHEYREVVQQIEQFWLRLAVLPSAAAPPGAGR